MCDIDLEPSDFWSERKAKARKQHRCDCCGGAIRPGDVYLRHFSVYDGVAVTEKECPACMEMGERFAKEHGQRSNPSYMGQLLRDCLDSGEGDHWRADIDAMKARKEAARAS